MPISEPCAEELDWILRYLDGELAEPLCRKLERHLAECPRCHTVFHTLRRTIELCRRYGRIPMPEEVRERLLGVVRRAEAAEGHERPSSGIL